MMAIATLETQQRNHAFPYRKVVAPPVPSVALSVSFSDLVPDPAAALTWQFGVVRTGDRTGAVAVDWAITAGASPIPASFFVGGVYPSGTVAIPAGQPGGTASFRTAAGGQPIADQFATLALLNPTSCTLGSPASAALRLPGKVTPAQDQVSLTCPDTSWTVDAASHDHLVTVVRTNSLGTYLAGTQVRVRLVGTGGNPIVAADVSGGLLDTTVIFAAGETSRPFTVTTLPGAAPAADKTGRVEVLAPVGGQLAATGTRVDVTIPHAVVTPPTGVLPPQYTDPNWTGMSASSGSPVANYAALQAECAALSGNVLCKTKYIELAPSFNNTGTMNLPYKGYVSGGKIYPLIIRSVLANIGDRGRIGNLAHFRHIDLNNAVWVWLHGLAVEVPMAADPNGGSQFQNDFNSAIEMDGSTDCLVTRCWLDSPSGIHSNDAIRPRIGANDFYGTTRDLEPTNAHPSWPSDPWTTQLRFVCSGKTAASQVRTVGALVYQNLMGNLRAPFTSAEGKQVDSSGAFYQGEGVEPNAGVVPAYPDEPYDLNCLGGAGKDCWFFDNLVMTTRNFLVYHKHAWKVWRNRVVAIAKFTDTTGTGSAFHYLASRGGNWKGGEFKYNSTEGQIGDSSHCDFQVWNGTVEFNDFNGIACNIWVSSDQSGGKGLVATAHWRFRGNTDGHYQIGMDRCDGGYFYNGPMADNAWEGEVAGDDGGPRWTWMKTGYQGNKTKWNPAGTDVQWSTAATAKNTEKMTVAFPGDTAKLGCDIGQLSKSAATAAVRQLTTAHADADYPGEFTKGRKGIVSQDGLTWDYVGDGGGGGGGDYGLIAANMTVWWPSDDMATDYPHTFVNFIAGGGFEVKAQNSPADSPHACVNIWHKTAPPAGDCVFTFHFTLLDANTSAQATPEGIFALFRVRQKGSDGFPADPNSWTKAQYRPASPYAYLTPGSDLMVRDRTSGYRHSLANHADTLGPSMQFRCRLSDGGNDGVDGSTNSTPTVPNPVPTTGDSFDFAQNVKYRLEYTRTGTTCTCVKTKVSDGTTQTWTYVDAKLGPAGQGVGGWCGFGANLGRWFKVEPVAGVPFCSAAA